MHYSFPQNMVETVRAWPEYKKLFDSLRRKGVDVERIIEHLSALFGLSWRGNIVTDCKHNRNSMCLYSHTYNFIMLKSK